jgi:hypothetical protein
MTTIPHATSIVQMHRILESAVILSWKDLLHPSQRDLIQIEYVPGPPVPIYEFGSSQEKENGA